MDERIEALEVSELEGGPEGIGVQGYSQLLALYLVDSQLCHAKFLWKRIPQSMKTNQELAALWSLGQKLWQKDIPGFYIAVKAFQWSPTTLPIVNQLVEGTREKITRLLGTAYTSVRCQDVAILLGVTEPEVEQLVLAQGWTISAEGMIQPKEPPSVHVQTTSNEEQIAKLTDYVTFLEN